MAEENKIGGKFSDPITETVKFMTEYSALDKKQKLNFTLAISKFFAFTVMIFLRRKIGYRFIKPIRIIITAYILIALPSILPLALF